MSETLQPTVDGDTIEYQTSIVETIRYLAARTNEYDCAMPAEAIKEEMRNHPELEFTDNTFDTLVEEGKERGVLWTVENEYLTCSMEPDQH